MIDLIEKLEGVKKFKEKEVEDEKIYLLLHFANYAPSIGNLQPWNFIVVKDKSLKEKLSEACLHQKFISFAPLVIIIAIDIRRLYDRYGTVGERVYSIQESSHLAMMIKIGCAYLNLGCFFVRAFDENKIKEIFKIPENYRVFYVIPIGYPDQEFEVEERIPFSNLTYIDNFGNIMQVDEKIILRLKSLIISKKSEIYKLEEKF